MKKLIFIIFAFIFVPLQACAVENGDVFNVKTDSAYIIPLKSRPLNLKNTNNEVLNADSVTGIDMSDSSLLVTTLKEGIAYVSFKQKNSVITLKFLVDNKAEENTTLIKLDKAEPVKAETKAAETGTKLQQTEQNK